MKRDENDKSVTIKERTSQNITYNDCIDLTYSLLFSLSIYLFLFFDRVLDILWTSIFLSFWEKCVIASMCVCG